jgi:prophage antirepressor-like protein
MPKGGSNLLPPSTPGGMQDMLVLSEPDVMRLIVKSGLPAADEFERWIFEEVLPTIRATGSYGTPVPDDG